MGREGERTGLRNKREREGETERKKKKRRKKTNSDFGQTAFAFNNSKKRPKRRARSM